MLFRLMFWIDDTGQSVMRGGMDGTNITTIHNDTAMSFGLAIDTEGITLTKTNVPNTAFPIILHVRPATAQSYQSVCTVLCR